MKYKLLIVICCVYIANCSKPKKGTAHPKTEKKAKHEDEEVPVSPSRPIKEVVQIIDQDTVNEWAKNISEILLENEERVVRRKMLIDSFTDLTVKTRNGSAIVEQMAQDLEELLTKRLKAAEAIMKKAERLASENYTPPNDYTFDYSTDLDQLKKMLVPESKWDLPEYCRSVDKRHVTDSAHFDAQVTLDSTSAQMAAEVFDCDPSVVQHLYWSEGLLSTFKENYAQDASMDFQYFCSAKGFLRTYPGVVWNSVFKLKLQSDVADVYDCRLRPWYVGASGAPRDILLLVDATGSMDNSTNQVIAEQFTLTMLNALTDDDHVNVLRFNILIGVRSQIACFNEKLVPANHVNSAAIMSELKQQVLKNRTEMEYVLRYAVNLLQKQRGTPDRPAACQQAIILITDSIEHNFTQLLRDLDPEGQIRLFVMWLHDRFGLRDNTREYGHWLSCTNDGYFAELVTDSDVTEQVMRVLRILERPLVAQREERLKVFSDLYAFAEDPRRSELYWREKENAEQVYRYMQLRRNKQRLLNNTYKHHLHQQSLDKQGFYYEGQDKNYRLQISVSIPVFDSTTVENITIQLEEEDPRNATRTYPVNRLLGVAGVDIPVDHLKLIMPYYQLGAGGSLCLIDNRGNIVLHDNLKPLFDGDILKPGYRTVDFLHLEQSGAPHELRDYPSVWKKFRNMLLLQESKGTATLTGLNVHDNFMRATVERREYHWRRVADHYTAVVVLPPEGRRVARARGVFTQQLAAEAWKTLSRTDFAVQPDWLYCRHVEPYYESRETEVRHFIKRRSDEKFFPMKNLKHLYLAVEPGLFNRTYQCNEELMARFCQDAVATSGWAEQHSKLDCSSCGLGSLTAFFASENGLTRWQQYHVVSAHALPPAGSEWPGGPAESWYRRAVAAGGQLVVHAPVTPYRRMRNTEANPPPVGIRGEWMTAARAMEYQGGGLIGVAGFHFHPRHLTDLLDSVTKTCEEKDPNLCPPKCDGKIWTCLLIDDGGWVVAQTSGGDEPRRTLEDPIRPHLATLYPRAMAALLDERVFKLHWLHDYQGVCFPPEDGEEKSSAAVMLPSLLRNAWRSIFLLFQVAKQIATVITLLSSGGTVYAETEKEKLRRRNRLRDDYEREKFERQYDARVLVNRTKVAACDRSRPFYVLQRDARAMEALRQQPRLCGWPLTGAPVPHTNLLLVAYNRNCSDHLHKTPPDPFVNQKVNVTELIKKKRLHWGELSQASELACWRNVQPLPARPPDVRCFPHNYTQEAGYRQCEPWKPNPPEKNASLISVTSVPRLLLLAILLCCVT